MSWKVLSAPVVAVALAFVVNLYAGSSLEASAAAGTSNASSAMMLLVGYEHAPNSSLHYGGSWWHHVPSTVHHQDSWTPTPIAKDAAQSEY